MKPTIKVSVLYPHGADKKFDIAYYCNKHVPMVVQLLSPEVKSGTVEKGLAGGAPGAPPMYTVMSHLYFDTMEDFQKAFTPHAETILADIPNFTNSEPIIQISEVLID